MRLRSTLVLAVVLLAGSARADDLKSGPQVGDDIPGRFNPLWLNGDYAGKRSCPV